MKHLLIRWQLYHLKWCPGSLDHYIGGRLSLRNYNAQVGETYAMIKALNKLIGLGMPETQYII
ncbi:hypothetical protein B4950_10725 [Vibrio cholerae]|nr:hypothetical protein [Vibrio cholerae]